MYILKHQTRLYEKVRARKSKQPHKFMNKKPTKHDKTKQTFSLKDTLKSFHTKPTKLPSLYHSAISASPERAKTERQTTQMNITCNSSSHLHMKNVPANSDLNSIHTKIDTAIKFLLLYYLID